jgi:2-polyprenyl-3-methyl-5-hydroxy-6-metoxy-1,4-benzoquinol methylase
MTQDTAQKVATYWNDVAGKFDTIYSGRKNPVARALDGWLRRDMFERFDWVMRMAGDVRNSRICDVGCGSGRFVAELAKRGASRVVGVDVAPEMLRLAGEHVASTGVAEHCEFVRADIEHWMTEERFDLVIAIGFWDYIADPRSRLAKIRHLCERRFLSAWPRAGTWRAPVRKARLSALDCPVYFYRRDAVCQLLEGAGFTISSISEIGQLYCVDARLSRQDERHP